MVKRPLAAIILAAGKGTRMKSRKAKVLHKVGGKPMVVYPTELAREFGADPVVVVVGHQAEQVKEAVTQGLSKDGVKYAVQKEQRGTGHAVMAARRALKNFNGDVLIISGDVPLMTKPLLAGFYKRHLQAKALVSVLTTRVEDPTGYGRCVVDSMGRLSRIVEEQDSSMKEKAIKEVNTGIYLIDKRFLCICLM